MKKKKKAISPLTLSLLHLLPSLLLLALISIGFFSLWYSEEHQLVLGNQTNQPQIKTVNSEDRLFQLKELGKKIRSESLEKEIKSME